MRPLIGPQVTWSRNVHHYIIAFLSLIFWSVWVNDFVNIFLWTSYLTKFSTWFVFILFNQWLIMYLDSSICSPTLQFVLKCVIWTITTWCCKLDFVKICTLLRQIIKTGNTVCVNILAFRGSAYQWAPYLHYLDSFGLRDSCCFLMALAQHTPGAQTHIWVTGHYWSKPQYWAQPQPQPQCQSQSQSQEIWL